MKKLTIIGLAICFAFALAAPATAVDVDFSGDYTVKGFYTEHWDLANTSASNAYMNMCFTLETVFKVNDILSVTTEFDALDRVWGTSAETTATSTTTSPARNTYATDTDVTDSLNFTRAYMTIKAPIGTFYVGRQVKGLWGTSFIDTEGDADRIKYVKKIDNLTLYAVFQKNAENDDAVGARDAADQDSDTYYLLGKYKAENVTSGLLLAFTNGKTTATQDATVYTAIPYFVSKFGPLAIQGELGYKWGQTEFDSGDPDLDIKQLAYNLEATYNFGPASVMAGYAFLSGDDDATDDENSAYGSVGAEWEKLFILTYDEDPVNNLGGDGNLTAAGDYGAEIFYGGVTFSPLDNLELGVVVGMANADEVQFPNQDDEIGFEYDLTLNWEIYDNLTYTAIAAFLDAGDIWQGGDATVDVENTYALFHQLELAF